MIDPTTALAFSLFENRGVYAVLLGSGVSRAAQIPTGWEIVLKLTERLAALEGVRDEIDWAAWHQTRFGEPPNYSRLLDALAQTPDERRALLHRFIEPTAEDLEEDRKTPTRAHRAIARLVRDGYVRVIVTTNFDRLMENALRELGVEPTVIKSDDDLQGATPLIHTRCLLLKVHGDYLDTRLRNTEGELAAYSAPLDVYLDRILDEHGLIVCGWSGDWDEALRAAIVRAPARRYPVFWASRGEPSALSADLITQRGGRVAPIADADSFFETLQQKVEVQATLMRPNPLSTELLIGTVKRYLARPEHRIQMADLVTGEVRRARRQAETRELDPHQRWSPEEFQRRVAVYEATFEPLIRMAFALGRWGDGAELPLARDLLQALSRPRSGNGTTVWLRLEAYPGVLLFTAFGLGAAQAGRLAALKAWLTTQIRKEHRAASDPAAEALFLEAWDGGEPDLWRMLEGLDGRKAPLSDHLCEVLKGLCGAEFLTAADLELAFNWFEALAALEFTACRIDRDTLDRVLSGRPGQQDFVRTPIGRLGWDETHQEVVLERLGPSGEQAALLAAGFAKGDEAFLELMTQNLRKAIGRFRW